VDGNKKKVKPIRKRHETKKEIKFEENGKRKIMKEMKYEKIFKFNSVSWLLLPCAVLPVLVNILCRFPSKTSVHLL